jgi:hypothetical protein
MAEPNPLQQATTDPDRVPEVICDGAFNVHISGGLATLTFTHVRPESEEMFGNNKIKPTAVVRARIVITVGNLAALRDLLNRMTRSPGDKDPAPATGGGTRH